MNLGVEFKAEKIDIVADRYFENSLKGGTRKDRGTGSRFVFNDETKFPNDFIDNFSKYGKNKDDINKYLAQKFLILIADKGYQHIQIRSADIDVIILSIAHSEIIFRKGVNVLNVNCGSGKFYNVKSISVQLGADVCKALPFFHTFTGCHIVSSFYHHGKCKFFDTWMELNKVNAELNELFKSLSNIPDQIKSTDVHLLGSFLMKVHQQNSKRDISLDIFRMNQFSKCTSFNPRNLIFSRKGLPEHTKRAALQTG